jgi:hypothetical protein
MRRWKQPVSLGCDVYDPDNSRHHQGMDHDVAEADRRTHKKLAKHWFLPNVDAHLNFTSKLLVFWRSSCKVNIAEVSWRTCGGKPMISANQSPAADIPSDAADQVDQAALAEVMRVVPLGAGVLAGTTVALLVIGYLAIYLLIFLPRGPVG